VTDGDPCPTSRSAAILVLGEGRGSRELLGCSADVEVKEKVLGKRLPFIRSIQLVNVFILETEQENSCSDVPMYPILGVRPICRSGG
jgi:hypothetical protein